MLPGLTHCIMSIKVERVEGQKAGRQISRKISTNKRSIHRLEREFLPWVIRESFVKSWTLKMGRISQDEL